MLFIVIRSCCITRNDDTQISYPFRWVEGQGEGRRALFDSFILKIVFAQAGTMDRARGKPSNIEHSVPQQYCYSFAPLELTAESSCTWTQAEGWAQVRGSNTPTVVGETVLSSLVTGWGASLVSPPL